jgi:hypothetical protein
MGERYVPRIAAAASRRSGSVSATSIMTAHGPAYAVAM